MFLMYYVIRFLGKLVAKITNALLDAICKLIDFVTPFAKNIYYLLLGIICILFSLGGLLFILYILSGIFGDCSGHTNTDHVHFEKY